MENSGTSSTECDRDDNSLGRDPCALEDADRRNRAVFEYMSFVAPSSAPPPASGSACPRDARMSMGVRRTLGNVNPDSGALFSPRGAITRGRGRIETYPRWTNGVPNMDKGGLSSDTESYVRMGGISTHLPACHTVSEVGFDRTAIVAETLAAIPEEVLNTDLRVGKFTRDALECPEYR